MTLRERFIRQPQNVFLRRALFQIHLWTGIGVGLYMLVISISGSAIVFRREISKLVWQRPTVVPTGRLMTAEELSAAAKQAYPRFDIAGVSFSKDPTRAAEVSMMRGPRRRDRVFDPYTGKDLGDVAPDEPHFLTWLVKLHDDLLADRTGRLVNGAGALLLTLLSLTGAIIWWPGVARWRRSMFVRWKVSWPRFNWDLHSAIGFWMFLFVLMWGVSGIYLSYPAPFTDLVDYLEPIDPGSAELRFGDNALELLARIHFGRAYGIGVKWLYTVLGLAPAVLFITGAVMWWNRVLRKVMLSSNVAPALGRPAMPESGAQGVLTPAEPAQDSTMQM
jgi:uncharacterized iron-regulated membrane protein